MRVEAESTSSHGAAIVAFEASGLRARVFLPKRLRCNGFRSVLFAVMLGYCTTLLALKKSS